MKWPDRNVLSFYMSFLKKIMDRNDTIIPRKDIARAVFESLTHIRVQHLDRNHDRFLDLILYMIDNCDMLAGEYTKGDIDKVSIGSSSRSSYSLPFLSRVWP